ncbi:MAG: hypothetical protein HGB08_03695 [Candidatus Moranbacteria bacterium]|nr:hypothetical protein [Candidatus Moranbacteria bacterium]
MKKVKEFYYDKQLSVQEVADKLCVSIDAVFYCMRKNGLARRKKYESNAIRYERSEPSFALKKINCERLRTLKAIGTMLYWGEGCKSEKMSIVDFANSDSDMIVLFLKFLREVCGINEKKLRVFPYFHANQDIDRNINYWSHVTGIDKSQFTKPYIRQDYDVKKRGRMPYGLVHIRYADKKLLHLIKSWIEEYRKY